MLWGHARGEGRDQGEGAGAPSLSASVHPRGGPTFVASIARGLTVFLGLCALAAILLPERANTDASLGENAFELVFALAALCIAVGVSWRTFKTIARSYESKRCSELQVTLHAYWSLVALAGFAMTMSMSLVEGGSNGTVPYGLAVFGCWVAYDVGLRAWLRRTMRHAGASLGPLLLLRVFKGSAASQAFMDRFLAYWRFAAPVWMIGGADLAGSQMEPTEFFAFIRRRLDGLFVNSPAGISERLGQIDAGRDPDARFRITELFCSNATWQAMVRALMARAAVVILDLREYTARHVGTRYEIFELLNVAAVDKVLVLIGTADDETQIESELQTAWNAMREDSPNRHSPTAALQVLRLRSGRGAEIRGLAAAAAAIAQR
jgi:hypothetical protein